jgi:hypothetical protein
VYRRWERKRGGFDLTTEYIINGRITSPETGVGSEDLGSRGGWRPFEGDVCGRSESDVRDTEVECPSFPPSTDKVLDSIDGGIGSSSLIWSINGDGAGLFDPIDNLDSSVSARNLTGGSFDSSSEDSRLNSGPRALMQVLTHDDFVSFDQQSGLLSRSSRTRRVKLGQSCIAVSCYLETES